MWIPTQVETIMLCLAFAGLVWAILRKNTIGYEGR